MKGIILAAGLGTRLYPSTISISKQLLPVYDKPMIYYPLSVLMHAEIQDILIISTPSDLPNFQKLLGDGTSKGLNLHYKEQKAPNGLAEAFILGKEFIQNDDVCLVLGDNIFFGLGFKNIVLQAKENIKKNGGGNIFAYQVQDPERYGIAEFTNGKVTTIEEKPQKPKSNFAVTGLYFYDNNVISIAENLKPSARGELEITDVNQHYLQHKKLSVELLGEGFAWLDTGTHDSLLDASDFVATIEKRQGIKIACLEEIAYKNQWINKLAIQKIINQYSKNSYSLHLQKIISS